MENYLVSARKYRPETFRTVVGQSALTTTLQNAIKHHQLAHAYLFCGPRGVGKTTCARIFAKAINCTNLSENGEACNQCESCQSFNEQRSYNIYELDAASNNSVDDIRALTEQVRIPPALGSYKVYIIDEVHMLTTSAFNAFLKTLEEPPAHAIFILATTEKHKIIPTILSRCQIYDFHRIGTSDIQDYLSYVAQSEGIIFEPEALNVIAMKADGGMRDALSIFDRVAGFGEGKVLYKSVIDNLKILDYDYYFRLLDHCLAHQTGDALLLFDEVLNQGFEGLPFLTGLCSHLRDLLVCKDARCVKLLEVSDSIKQHYLSQAEACGFDFLLSSLKLANECSLQYAQSRNKRLLVELCLIRMCLGESDAPSQLPPLSAPSSSSVNTATTTSTSTPSPTQPASVSPPVPTQPPAKASLPSSSVSKPSASSVQTNPVTSARSKAPLSIKNLSKVQVESAPEEKAPEVQVENQPYEWDAFVRYWNLFADTIQDDPQLHHVLRHTTPSQLSEQHQYELVVSQAHIQKRIEEIKPQLEGFLQKELHNSHIAISLRISESNEKKMALTPQDQLNAMMEKNASIDLLRQTFRLRVD